MQIVAKVLKDQIKKVKYAMCTDATRPHINQIHLRVINGFLQTIATDGHRLAITYFDLKVKGQAYSDLIGWSINLNSPVIEMIKQASDTHTFILNSRFDSDCGNMPKVTCASGYTTLTEVWSYKWTITALDYPPIDQVIPSCFEAQGTFSVRALKTIINKAKKAAKGAGTKDTYILLLSSGIEAGFDDSETKETAWELDTLTKGDHIENAKRVYLELRYLYDLLRDGGQEIITIKTCGQLDPIGVFDESGRILGVIMPRRVPR